MGLLDDAIREHLELKRRHGANPDDVQRQEHEALGDAPGGEFAEPAEVVDDETRVLEDREEDVAEAPGYEEDPWLEEEHDEVPREESLEHRGQPPATPEEDVLEETPEFLQETPEHERLWFEQRPPRDFDWDK